MALWALGISISSYDCNHRSYFVMLDCFVKAIAQNLTHQKAIAIIVVCTIMLLLDLPQELQISQQPRTEVTGLRAESLKPC